ncbi:hypothetical protein M426DRAFT_150130 [Hypoxylon sp. CI-4A]|nr:hypothetical protein M426DRAFT_150130 [Hypoxylon sp. CI-4A]
MVASGTRSKHGIEKETRQENIRQKGRHCGKHSTTSIYAYSLHLVFSKIVPCLLVPHRLALRDYILLGNQPSAFSTLAQPPTFQPPPSILRSSQQTRPFSSNTPKYHLLHIFARRYILGFLLVHPIPGPLGPFVHPPSLSLRTLDYTHAEHHTYIYSLNLTALLSFLPLTSRLIQA